MYDLSQYQKPASELATAIIENTESMKKFFANYKEPTSRQSAGQGSVRQTPRRNHDNENEQQAKSDRKRRNTLQSSGMKVKRIIIDFACEENVKVLSEPTGATVHEHHGRNREHIDVPEGDAANRFRPAIEKFLQRRKEEEAHTGEFEQFLKKKSID